MTDLEQLTAAIKYLRGTISAFDRMNNGLPYNDHARHVLLTVRAAEARIADFYDREFYTQGFKFYKKWCYIFVALTIFSSGLSVYATKSDPFCRWVEAKYQYIVQHSDPAVTDVYPSPAEGND